jgi:hypothetical protein
VTIAPREDVGVLSQAILRMYWDGDTNPSVECPIGAFFGVGFGEQKDFISMPLDETSGGYNCYWPMPFHKSARWTLTNGSGRPIDAFYYNIDYTALDSMPADTRSSTRSSAARTRRLPAGTTRSSIPRGAGHYVGTALFMAGKALYFLEGNEMVYIDGDRRPSIEGTGTEDYFCSGWYFDRGVYSAPYHGVIIKDEARSEGLRLPLAHRGRDPVHEVDPLHDRARHGKPRDGRLFLGRLLLPGRALTRAAAAPGRPAALELAPDDIVLDPRRGRGREAEGHGKVTGGGTWVQDMGNWEYGEEWSDRGASSGPGQPGSRMTPPLYPAPCRRHLRGRGADGRGPGPRDCPGLGRRRERGRAPVDLYAPLMTPREVTLGTFAQGAARFPSSFTVTGKNPTLGRPLGRHRRLHPKAGTTNVPRHVPRPCPTNFLPIDRRDFMRASLGTLGVLARRPLGALAEGRGPAGGGPASTPVRGPDSMFTGEQLDHVAFPMGGIGAGMICLEGNGRA